MAIFLDDNNGLFFDEELDMLFEAKTTTMANINNFSIDNLSNYILKYKKNLKKFKIEFNEISSDDYYNYCFSKSWAPTALIVGIVGGITGGAAAAAGSVISTSIGMGIGSIIGRKISEANGWNFSKINIYDGNKVVLSIIISTKLSLTEVEKEVRKRIK